MPICCTYIRLTLKGGQGKKYTAQSIAQKMLAHIIKHLGKSKKKKCNLEN